MKLATLKNGTRDGQLIIVSKDLSRGTKVPEICMTMQHAMDNWEEIRPKLEKVYTKLNDHTVEEIFNLEPKDLEAPLPRAYQWADGSAYVTHVELVRKARGAELPDSFWHDPLMYQGGSDSFIGPCDAILAESEDFGVDFEAEIVVITDDVPMGRDVEGAGHHIQLVGLINDVSFRNLIPNEIAKFFGFFHSKPACSFAPVFVTLDELGDNWRDNKLHLPLISTYNGDVFGKPNAGVDMTFDFAQLISHAAKTRKLGAGTIIGSGTVANKDPESGSSCIAEKRMREKLDCGEMKTPFMVVGDRIKIEMLDEQGKSIFGAINQIVQPYVNLVSYEHDEE
ncbi:MAG: fumarylacetoacetate hydrolase family protein [Lentisphaerales bacterium]|nr:fumarylacetoacetate hydrolase family protein [Lentisphaerales bacterium]